MSQAQCVQCGRLFQQDPTQVARISRDGENAAPLAQPICHDCRGVPRPPNPVLRWLPWIGGGCALLMVLMLASCGALIYLGQEAQKKAEATLGIRPVERRLPDVHAGDPPDTNIMEDWPLALPAETAAPGPARPMERPPHWIGPQDYPAVARRQGWEGTVGFLVDVTDRGQPSGCSITRSSGHELLDRQTCALVMRRASFDPARDLNGYARAGRWQGEVTWRFGSSRSRDLRTARE